MTTALPKLPGDTWPGMPKIETQAVHLSHQLKAAGAGGRSSVRWSSKADVGLRSAAADGQRCCALRTPRASTVPGTVVILTSEQFVRYGHTGTPRS